MRRKGWRGMTQFKGQAKVHIFTHEFHLFDVRGAESLERVHDVLDKCSGADAPEVTPTQLMRSSHAG